MIRDHIQNPNKVEGDLDVTGNVSGATYGSDSSVTDAELLYINTLTSNAQDQIDSKAAAGANSDITSLTGLNSNVGIGTSSPDAPLHIDKDNTVNHIHLEAGTGTDDDVTIGFEITDTEKFSIGIDNSDGDKFKISNRLSIGDYPRLIIDTSGNVGIGTSPETIFEIKDTSGSGSGYIKFSGDVDNTYGTYWIMGESVLQIGTDSSSRGIALQINEVTKMTLDTSGNVGIGTTSPGSKLAAVGLPEYADNAAAKTGGLSDGDFYHTAGVLKVTYTP